MLLFRSEEHVARWCRIWSLPRGSIFTLEQGWALSKAWYNDRLSPHWRSKSAEEAEAIFRKIGLRSTFWKMKRT